MQTAHAWTYPVKTQYLKTKAQSAFGDISSGFANRSGTKSVFIKNSNKYAPAIFTSSDINIYDVDFKNGRVLAINWDNYGGSITDNSLSVYLYDLDFTLISSTVLSYPDYQISQLYAGCLGHDGTESKIYIYYQDSKNSSGGLFPTSKVVSVFGSDCAIESTVFFASDQAGYNFSVDGFLFDYASETLLIGTDGGSDWTKSNTYKYNADLSGKATWKSEFFIRGASILNQGPGGPADLDREPWNRRLSDDHTITRCEDKTAGDGIYSLDVGSVTATKINSLSDMIYTNQTQDFIRNARVYTGSTFDDYFSVGELATVWDNTFPDDWIKVY